MVDKSNGIGFGGESKVVKRTAKVKKKKGFASYDAKTSQKTKASNSSMHQGRIATPFQTWGKVIDTFLSDKTQAEVGSYLQGLGEILLMHDENQFAANDEVIYRRNIDSSGNTVETYLADEDTNKIVKSALLMGSLDKLLAKPSINSRNLSLAIDMVEELSELAESSSFTKFNLALNQGIEFTTDYIYLKSNGFERSEKLISDSIDYLKKINKYLPNSKNINSLIAKSNIDNARNVMEDYQNYLKENISTKIVNFPGTACSVFDFDMLYKQAGLKEFFDNLSANMNNIDKPNAPVEQNSLNSLLGLGRQKSQSKKGQIHDIKYNLSQVISILSEKLKSLNEIKEKMSFFENPEYQYGIGPKALILNYLFKIYSANATQNKSETKEKFEEKLEETIIQKSQSFDKSLS